MRRNELFLLITILCLALGFGLFRMGGFERMGFSSVAMVLLCLPMIAGCLSWLGMKRGGVLLLTLSVMAYVIETCGLLTGFPYGFFQYSGSLGRLFFGVTPWTVPFGWVPLVFLAFVLSRSFLTAEREAGYWKMPLVLLLADLLLDPVAVRLGFWRYTYGGWYAGVPFTNYFGWILSGCLGTCLMLWLVGGKKIAEPTNMQQWLMGLSGWMSLSLFAGVAIVNGLWLPFVFYLVLLGFFVQSENKNPLN